MKFVSDLYSWLKKLLLRGSFLRFWLSRRCRQWETAYRAELAKTFPNPTPPDRGPAISPPTRELRRILLIADCMWEQNDLVPEFSRIAATRLLDLRPGLKHQPLERHAGIVVETVRKFAKNNSDYEPDVILFYARPLLLSEEVFQIIRAAWRGPLLGMNLDDKIQFFDYGVFSLRDDNYQSWAKKFDLNITNCLPATDWYRSQGLPVIYSPQGVHRPQGMKMPDSAAFKHKLGFLGSIKPEREIVIEQLRHAHVPIELFGAGWPNSRWVDDPNSIFRATQLNLGIGLASPSDKLTTVKGRDFECPGVGACYVTTFNWELPQHYEIGKEILCYRSIEELIEIYSYYQSRPEACLQIAQAAWRRCSAEHTWELRFRRIFREVGFKV
jgi:hypothetical protein